MNPVPAVCTLGVPVLPVAVPGIHVSPGRIISSFASAPAPTVMLGLVLSVLPPSLASIAVSVQVPAVLKVTGYVWVPAANAALDGNTALASVLVIPTASITLETTFQYASTAFAVTVSSVPAVCAEGVPVLPVAVPGAAVSPGTSSCSFSNGPATTVYSVPVPAVR